MYLIVVSSRTFESLGVSGEAGGWAGLLVLMAFGRERVTQLSDKERKVFVLPADENVSMAGIISNGVSDTSDVVARARDVDGEIEILG